MSWVRPSSAWCVFIDFYLNCSVALHYFSFRPITPDHVKYLIDKYKGDKLTGIYVQPSHRIFPDSQYENAGAIITDDLSDADILLGVKRVKNETDMIPDKTYMFFSHTVKGQPQNMELLKVHHSLLQKLDEIHINGMSSTLTLSHRTLSLLYFRQSLTKTSSYSTTRQSLKM